MCKFQSKQVESSNVSHSTKLRGQVVHLNVIPSDIGTKSMRVREQRLEQVYNNHTLVFLHSGHHTFIYNKFKIYFV